MTCPPCSGCGTPMCGPGGSTACPAKRIFSGCSPALTGALARGWWKARLGWKVRSSSPAAAAIAAQVWAGRGHSYGLARFGAEMVRPWWRMDMDLSATLPEPLPVDGYQLRDGDAVPAGGWSDVHNRSFADHWRFSPRQEAELVTGRPPHLALMVTTREGTPTALTLAQIESYPEDAREQPVGIISSVGTVPEHRRRGLATWLVAEELLRLRAEGARSASLYVDGWNHTRAFDAYRKLGFELAFESEVWEATF